MYVQSSILRHHRDFFCLHVATRRPIASHPLSADAGQVATEIDSTGTRKYKISGPRRAFARRTQFQAAITVAEEANKTLRVC